METKPCACNCGEMISADSPWKYKRGHKPKLGSGSSRSTPRTGLAKRERPIVIEAQLEAAEPEYVDCQISVPQLDTIFSLLKPHSKAIAVLNGLEEEASE